MMESMDLARGFGELIESYMEMMACDMGVYNGEELECDTVVGYLTADDVFGRIKKHWEEKGGE